MKTILVTGGTGYIGSHACLALLEKNYRIIILDSNINSSAISISRINLIAKNNNFYSEIIFEKGDIRDKEFIKSVFVRALNRNSPIEAIVHFAGLKAVGESIEKPLNYWENNVAGTINLIKVMKNFDCFTMVFSSSAAIYGNCERIPIEESSTISPVNPYAFTKSAIEQFFKDISASSNKMWKIANLRYFNPIGSHASGLLGEDPLDKPNNLFPIICRVAKGIYKRLEIYGNDWMTPDGTGIRDYIHVMDLVEAHVITLEYLFNNSAQVLDLNVGTGKGTSVLDLIRIFSKVNKCKIPYEYCQRRKGDVPILIADNKKIINTLNWAPKRNLEQMCIDGWRWQILNPYGYQS